MAAVKRHKKREAINIPSRATCRRDYTDRPSHRILIAGTKYLCPKYFYLVSFSFVIIKYFVFNSHKIALRSSLVVHETHKVNITEW